MEIREELEQVFDDEFDINACEALYRFVSTLTGGKTKLVRAVLDNFGYSLPLRERIEKVSISTQTGAGLFSNYKEEPWLDAPKPSSHAVTNLKGSLMGLSSKSTDARTLKAFIDCLNQNPSRVAWQWVNYWKVLSYLSVVKR